MNDPVIITMAVLCALIWRPTRVLVFFVAGFALMHVSPFWGLALMLLGIAVSS